MSDLVSLSVCATAAHEARARFSTLASLDALISLSDARAVAAVAGRCDDIGARAVPVAPLARFGVQLVGYFVKQAVDPRSIRRVGD